MKMILKLQDTRGLLMVFAFLCLPFLMTAQNLLTPSWKFNTGDNLAWAQAATNDTDWKDIRAGLYWENQGISGYDGFAWYRKKIVIPSSLKKQASENGGFILQLGTIDDADYTYFNGELIGKNGDIPPHYATAYDAQRKYVVPVSKIKWDQDNLIAVRVYDGGGNGGIFGDQVSLKAGAMEDYLLLEPGFKEADRIVITDGPVSVPIRLKNNSNTLIKGTLSVQISTDMFEKIGTKSTEVSLAKKKTLVVPISMGELKAGFYIVRASFEGDLANLSSTFNFGLNPEKISSPADQPSDLENYWNRAKKELAAVDPQFRLIRIDSLCTAGKEWYVLEMRSLGNVLVRGYYGKPVKPGKYPAILHVQGYSTNQIPQWGYQGNDLISLVLNIRGHGNSKDNINPGFAAYPSYLQYQLADKEMYIYRGAYMDCRRALDFLFSREEVDTSRVAVEGGSQGGALTYATAALNNDRIKVAVAAVPFLSDFPDYFRCANWPAGEFTNYVKDHPEVGWSKVFETLSYIDIKNLAGWVKCPLLMGVGLVDVTCPPHINFAAYNQLKSTKEYVVYPVSGHSLPAGFDKEKMNFIRKHFGLN